LVGSRNAASSCLLGSSMHTHYRLRAPLVGRFGAGAIPTGVDVHLSWIPTVAVTSRPRSSAVGLKARGPSPRDHRFAILCLAGSSTEQSALCVSNLAPVYVSVTMDYSYFGAQQQPYQFLGISPDGFPHTGVDPETIRSVVRYFGERWLCIVAPHFSPVDKTMTNPNTT
jgi:hypothetical protein